MLAKKKPVVRVKNTLGDDVYGMWHVKKIEVRKDRRRYAFTPDKETFRTKDDAEHYADIRVQRFVAHKLKQNSDSVCGNAIMKYLFGAAFIFVMTALAVQWRRERP